MVEKVLQSAGYVSFQTHFQHSMLSMYFDTTFGEVAQHPNITLYTYAELVDLMALSKFSASIKLKAKSIVHMLQRCGDCIAKCQ
jgi:heterodisulfide reductase subunit A-like polyferredoxin